MSRPAYAGELTAAFLFSFVLAVIEGGVIGVFIKQTFSGTVDPRWLNVAVALSAAANEVANLVSFGWVMASHGRRKVRFIAGLQCVLVAAVVALAFMPRSAAGLAFTVGAVLVARVCWSGVVTLRTVAWRMNYPREIRSRVVANLSSVTQTVVAVCGLMVGVMLDADPGAFAALAPCAAAVALLGVRRYSRVRVRGEAALLAGEREKPRGAGVLRPWSGFMAAWGVLRADARFAQFMGCMFLLGMGNLMLMPVLAISLKAQFGLGYTASIVVTSTIPALLIPLTTPLWATLLDRAHVVRFRAYHSWVFVVAVAVLLGGVARTDLWMMYAGSLLMGVGFGGGALAWNLGHTDFAPPTETSRYMATHVTLNGVRGLFAPLLSVWLYNAVLEEGAWGMPPGVVPVGVSLVFTVLGAAGFVWLYRSMGEAGRNATKRG